MIYIKRFLYVLFVVAISIIGVVLLFITVITFSFISMLDYVVHGEITKDYIMIVYEWLDDVSNKLKPE